MMKLKDVMKRTQPRPEAVMPEGPHYPVGLYISEETLKSLGISGVFEVGATLKIEAEVCVTNASKSESLYGEERSMHLGFKKMALAPKKGGDD